MQTTVQLFYGANAYAYIRESGVAHAVRLACGKSPAKSLREYAAEKRQAAERYFEDAARAERAAVILEG